MEIKNRVDGHDVYGETPTTPYPPVSYFLLYITYLPLLLPILDHYTYYSGLSRRGSPG